MVSGVATTDAEVGIVELTDDLREAIVPWFREETVRRGLRLPPMHPEIPVDFGVPEPGANALIGLDGEGRPVGLGEVHILYPIYVHALTAWLRW
jgi:hypothetical protein